MERLHNSFIGGAMSSVLFLGAASCSTPDQAPKPEAHQAAPSHSGDTLPVVEVKGLRKGDKITDIPVYTPEFGKETSFTLKPRQSKQPEDLGVVYSPLLSDLLTEAMGSDERLNGLSIGLLITSAEGKVATSVLLFETDTKEVTQFGPADEETVGVHRLFINFNKSGQEVFAALEAHPDGSATLTFDGVAPFEIQDKINHTTTTAGVTT